MDMSTMTDASTTMPSMAGMASSTPSSSMDMGGMSHGSSSSSGMMMGMSDMMMVFFTATNTPLYSSSWTPNSVGTYAGTCIFLIVLAFIFRGIIAVRCNFLLLWTVWSRKRDTDILDYERPEEYYKHARRPWRINEAAARAVLDTVLAGVSYLLMLAVMTMNVGYFCSILGWNFLGSFVLGGWIGTAAH